MGYRMFEKRVVPVPYGAKQEQGDAARAAFDHNTRLFKAATIGASLFALAAATGLALT